MPDAVLAKLSYQNKMLEQNKIEFPATKANFLKISFKNDNAFQLNSLQGEFLLTHEAIHNWTQLTAEKYNNVSEIEFDAHAYFPVDTLTINLPQNTLLKVKIFSKKEKDKSQNKIRFWLFGLRFLTILISHILLLDIFFKKTINETVDPLIVIAIDNSESMLRVKDSSIFTKKINEGLNALKSEGHIFLWSGTHFDLSTSFRMPPDQHNPIFGAELSPILAFHKPLFSSSILK